jgi:hypothetical protein
MLTLRDLVAEGEGGLFRPRPDSLDVLAYYANAIEHLLEGDGAGVAGHATSPAATVPA